MTYREWGRQQLLDAEPKEWGEPHITLLCLMYGRADGMAETATEWGRQTRVYGRINGISDRKESERMVAETLARREEYLRRAKQIENDLGGGVK